LCFVSSRDWLLWCVCSAECLFNGDILCLFAVGTEFSGYHDSIRPMSVLRHSVPVTSIGCRATRPTL
jgi:hypothetical protein